MKEALRDKNRLLSGMELDNGKRILKSTPQYVTIGAHFRCNARCIFCLGGDYPDFSLDVFDVPAA